MEVTEVVFELQPIKAKIGGCFKQVILLLWQPIMSRKFL